MKNIGFAIFASAICFLSSFSRAEELTSFDQYIGRWILVVSGDNRQRVLDIKSINASVDGMSKVSAVYGYSDAKLESVDVELTNKNGAWINIKTPVGSRVEVSLQKDNNFWGSFIPKNGEKSSAMLVKESSLGLFDSIPEKFLPEFKQAADGVPKACGDFIGVAQGTWQGLGPTWLWVVDVNEKCVAKYAYIDSPIPPASFREAEIKNGVLTIPIRSGDISFEYWNKKLTAKFSGSGFTANSVYEKFSLADRSIGKAFAFQRFREATILPASEVPEECASYFGNWFGRWAVGDFGTQRLTVSQIDKNCSVKLTYGPSTSRTREVIDAKIKSNKLTFICNPQTNGTCQFEKTSDGLSAYYSNPAGGTNTSIFRR